MRARKRIGVWPLVFVSALVYLAGLGLLMLPQIEVLETLVSLASAGNVESLLTVIQGPSFVSPYSFTTDAVADSSPSLVFPLGAVLFPLVLAGATWATSRPVGWLWTLCATAPFVGIGLGAANIPLAGVVDLVLFLGLPLLAVVGGVMTAIQSG